VPFLLCEGLRIAQFRTCLVVRIDNTTVRGDSFVIAGNIDFEALHQRARARGIGLGDAVLNALASLKARKNLLLFGETIDLADAVAELITDEAADAGLCYGTLILPPATVALISLEHILVDHFRSDFWLVLRRADVLSLRRIVDYLRKDRAESPQRLLATTVNPPRVLGGLTPEARRQLALIEVSTL
jgi:hypothetical protein